MPVIPSLRSQVRADILIPDTVYWLSSGVDRFIYWDSAFASNMPLSSLQIECDLTVGALTGKHYADRLEVPSATVLTPGSYPNALYVEVRYDGRQIGWKRSGVEVAANDAAVTRTVLAIGDSNTASETWINRLITLDTADANAALTFVGTQGSNPPLHEGWSGKTYSWMRTDVASPFVNAAVFDFANYLTANAITMTGSDWAVFMLGTNDFLTSAGSLIESQIATGLANLDAMISGIQTDVPGCRVLICPVMMPSASQDDFAANYGTGAARGRAVYNFKRWNTELMDMYDTAAQRSAGVYVASSHLVIDTVTQYSANAVHPISTGLQRVGDAIWQQIKAIG